MVRPGSYKAPLERGLRLLGSGEITENTHPGFKIYQATNAAHLTHLADGVSNGDIKLAVSSSIRSQSVCALSWCRAVVFIEALGLAKHEQDSDTQEICDYYIQGLREGRMVPAEKAGAYVYPYGDSHAKYVGSGDRNYAPGELFFGS